MRNLQPLEPCRGASRSRWRDPAVRSVLLLTAPRLFAYGINTINSVIATRFASSLGEAGVSRFYYANRLKELVLGGFGSFMVRDGAYIAIQSFDMGQSIAAARALVPVG